MKMKSTSSEEIDVMGDSIEWTGKNNFDVYEFIGENLEVNSGFIDGKTVDEYMIIPCADGEPIKLLPGERVGKTCLGTYFVVSPEVQ